MQRTKILEKNHGVLLLKCLASIVVDYAHRLAVGHWGIFLFQSDPLSFWDPYAFVFVRWQWQQTIIKARLSK